MIGELTSCRTEDLKDLRTVLDRAFSPETAAPGYEHIGGSAGHCAAVSVILRELYGGQHASAVVDGQSHWFNKLTVGGEERYVDLTGDQFGRAPVQISPSPLYDGSRIRSPEDLRIETLERAVKLAERAGLEHVAQSIRTKMNGRS